MIGKFFNFLTTKLSCALIGAQGIGMSKISPFVLESTTAELTDTGFTITTFMGQFLDWIGEIINSWVYIIAKYILVFIDFCQVITYKIAGIDNDLEKILEMPIFKFILHEDILKIIGTIMVLALILLILVTIIAIVKSEYEASFDDKKDPKNVAYKTMGKSLVSLFLMVITPFIIIISIIFSSVILSSINNVLNPNDTENATLGGTLFTTAAYNANKYRLYAADGKRIPVLLNFEDPYENGTYGFYTTEELYEIYKDWNGKEIYNMYASGAYQSFNETLVYKNGKIYNANNYSEYEKFVSTAEQYYVMADFIDYAVAHDITYYIKNSRDEQIDWSRTSSEIKISDGVYDPYRGTITLTYTDVSDLSPYDDYYTITFETSTALANTPITNAVSTISLILGLNSIVSGSTAKNITVSNSVGPSNLTNTSLSNSAQAVDDVIKQAAATAESSNVTFRLLERVAGSTNLVRWQTEKTIYNGVEYTVYVLEKIEKNKQTGINEVKATVKVAKKDDSLNSKYYVLKEEPNELGYYDYTNVEIDFYNDGKYYLDTLNPLFKTATWPEKLYNDLSVIYSDIDFDNYLAYDNWADALGVYYKTDNNATSTEISSFATTLVHPLGLIMSELFLGVTLEGGNGNTSSFSFASSYLEDIIDALTLSVSGQFDFKNMSYQIHQFISLFNAQFASVIESLQKIEGFDVYGNDAYSVQGEVYKAYLASIMLSSEYSAYLNKIADTLLTTEKLIEIIEYYSGSEIYDAYGNPVYEIKQLTDGNGNLIVLYYNDEEPTTKELLINGKAVYSKNGKKLYTANSNGILTSGADGIYIPKDDTKFIINKVTDSGSYYYAYKVFDKNTSEYISVDGDNYEKYFETYYYESWGSYYVYQPVDGDTGKNTAFVTKVLFTEDDTTLATAHEGYFLYEVEAVLKTNNNYLTYGQLPEVYQKFIDNIITTIKHDAEVGKYDEPIFLQFLIEYQQDGEEMAGVMGADIISKTTAEEFLANKDYYEKRIEYYTELYNESIFQASKQTYQDYIDGFKKTLNQLKKYYIINGLESFASTQASSGFTVVVNSHPFDVTQGVVQRELLEIIYGNNLLYTSIIGQLNSNTRYDELGSFDKNAYGKLIAFVELFNEEMLSLSAGTIDDALLFSGMLTDKQLNIVSKYYTIKTGVYRNFTNENLALLLDEQKTDLLKIISNTAKDVEKIMYNYINGRTINLGLIYNRTTSESYQLLAQMVKLAVGDAQLFFVEDDYYGLIDEEYNGFSLLRSFLKGFGDLCFDLARQSNLGSVGQEEPEDILEYINAFVDILNVKLEDIDFGDDSIRLTKINSSSDLKTIYDVFVESETTFYQLSDESKQYIYAIYDVYNRKVIEYESKLKEYESAKNYSARYIKGIYAMQSDSYIFATGLKEYLNYFRYNIDLSGDEINDYYHEYSATNKLEVYEDKLYYYNLYLSAFDGFNTGTNGVYYAGLTELQQKVIFDMAEYFQNQYDNFVNGTDEDYQTNKYNKEIFEKFIKGSISFDEREQQVVTPVGVVNNKSVKDLVDATENISLLNLYNLLDFLGLDYDINKNLSDYRLDALNMLVSFKERAGESGASIQARYLTLLNLVCSNYYIDAFGEKTIAVDYNTKLTILKLAGLKDVAEENLVGLTYEVVEENTIADEKYGSVFIICTYNSETNMYEPFVFASASNSFGVPVSSYYSSSENVVQFYPVIAKGVIGPDGLPTAIREVNGYIEFYRESAAIKDPGALGLDMYYMSVEDVSINYNPVNILVNGISKLYTGKSVAERILESVPVIVSSKNLNFCYGTRTDYVYHLENGQFTLNYMFYSKTGIDLNCLYKASELNTLILLFGTLVLATTLISAMFGVIRNLYDLIIIVMLYPGVLALYPIDDSIQGNWRKQFIDKILVMFGFIIAINGFFLILNLLQTMDIRLTLSEDSLMELKNTWLFNKFDMGAILNTLFTFVTFMAAISMIKFLPPLFSKMVNGGDVIKGGENTKKLVETHIQDASYFSSGYAVEDMLLSKADAMRNTPLIGSETRAKAREKKQVAANKKLVSDYKKQLKGQGISDKVADKAVEAYANSLNRQVEAERQRRLAGFEARKARIAKYKSREGIREKVYKTETKDKKKPKICPRCQHVNSPKAKECERCGNKLK